MGKDGRVGWNEVMILLKEERWTGSSHEGKGGIWDWINWKDERWDILLS